MNNLTIENLIKSRQKYQYSRFIETNGLASVQLAFLCGGMFITYRLRLWNTMSHNK